MRVAILGAGAIGCYYGAKMAVSGNELCYIMRSGYEAVKKNGITIHSNGETIRLPEVQVYKSVHDCGAVDLIIISWKSTSNHLLAESLPPLMHAETRVLTLQNGMGNCEALSAFLPDDQIYAGLCFIGAMMDEPGIIQHEGPSRIQLAPFKPHPSSIKIARHIADEMDASGIPMTTFDHLEQILWRKLSWNVPFNGLCTALGGITVGELFNMPEQLERARRIIAEVALVAKLRGYPLPDDIVDIQIEHSKPLGNFTPSTALDLINGRPVEYDAIWGIPMLRAQKVGASIPYWEQLAAEIRQRIGRA